MDIAERIKKLREIYNITSNDLAKITGIHPVSIRKYETNKMVPGIEVIDKMCEALKLPRMVFEGIPKQYTDYSFAGDFYQQLFLLIANGTLNIDGFINGKDKIETYFTLNQDLSRYIQIKNGSEDIPLENLSIHLNIPSDVMVYHSMTIYIDYLKAAKDARECKRWSAKAKGETREEYIARMNNYAEECQLELMLMGHSWQEHMSGIGSSIDDLAEGVNRFILAGGDYYEYIMQADLPETVKSDYIRAYEDAYVKVIVEEQNPHFPKDASREERFAWIDSINDQVEQYKKDHPDYKEQARKYAIENAIEVRKNSK